MLPGQIDRHTILLGITAYVGVLLVTEAISGDHPGRAASVGLPLVGLAWLATHPSARPAAAKTLAATSSVLGAASASLARAGMAVSGARP